MRMSAGAARDQLLEYVVELAQPLDLLVRAVHHQYPARFAPCALRRGEAVDVDAVVDDPHLVERDVERLRGLRLRGL